MWMNKIHAGFSKELFGFILETTFVHFAILWSIITRKYDQSRVQYERYIKLDQNSTVYIATSSSNKPLRADIATHLLLVVIYIILFQVSIYIWRKVHRWNTILVFKFVIFDTGFVFIKQALSKFMAGNRHNTEVPYQNYDKLKQTILVKRQRGKPELFIDPSFPPDLSSLTYVYIGDDRYERTKFARPLVGIICQMHVQCTCLMKFFIR